MATMTDENHWITDPSTVPTGSVTLAEAVAMEANGLADIMSRALNDAAGGVIKAQLMQALGPEDAPGGVLVKGHMDGDSYVFNVTLDPSVPYGEVHHA